MQVMDPVGVVILIAGVIALVLSTTVIFGRVPERVRVKGWSQSIRRAGPRRSVYSSSSPGRSCCRSIR